MRKHKFSVEEENKIIEFVKSNNLLLERGKNRDNLAAKNRLWKTLAKKMNIDGEYCVQCRYVFNDISESII